MPPMSLKSDPYVGDPSGWFINGTPFGYWQNQTLDCGTCSTPLTPSTAKAGNGSVIDGGTCTSLPTDLIPSRGAL